MSVLSRVLAPTATHELAGVASGILSNMDGAPLTDLSRFVEDRAPARHPVLAGPTGLGTSAARLPPPPAEPAASTGTAEPDLFCPGAVRDDPALGNEVNGRLIEWAEQVGIYPGRLDRLTEANFGRLMMLVHPGTDDPDRLLAAAKCVLAEWATDDHFLDEEALGADPNLIGSRLGVTHAAWDPAGLPADYAPQLDEVLSAEPVAVAYRSAHEHFACYATPKQLNRLRHQLSIMCMAYSHEAAWRVAGRIPPVWEYLTHRHQNSFLPPMTRVDPIAGYELPAFEFADPRVRRVFALAGSASVILNDVYSNAKESDTDFDLPKVIATEEGCSPRAALDRTVCIHNELMHTFVAEAAVLFTLGSPTLKRFLADIWAWLGGNREWHRTTARYHGNNATPQGATP